MSAPLEKFRFHMTDILGGFATVLYLARKFDNLWLFAVAGCVGLWYVGSIWVPSGRRLGLLFGAKKCKTWRRLSFPHRILYHCQNRPDPIAGKYDAVASDEEIQKKIGHVFRTDSRNEREVRSKVEVWLRVVQQSRKHLVYRALPGMAGGWAQIEESSAELPEKTIRQQPELSVCVLGLETYMLGAAEERKTCVHELVHAAQQVHRNLLWREWHGKFSTLEGISAEWQALNLAGQLSWAIFRAFLLPISVILFCNLL